MILGFLCIEIWLWGPLKFKSPNVIEPGVRLWDVSLSQLRVAGLTADELCQILGDGRKGTMNPNGLVASTDVSCCSCAFFLPFSIPGVADSYIYILLAAKSCRAGDSWYSPSPRRSFQSGFANIAPTGAQVAHHLTSCGGFGNDQQHQQHQQLSLSHHCSVM